MSVFDSITEGMEARISALTQQLADMTADRDSEHRWAEEYHRKWQETEKERDAAVAAVNSNIRESLRLLNLTFEGGELNVTAKHPIVPLLALQLSQYFREAGGMNYVEITFQAADMGPLTLTLQRRNGKTPHQLKTEALALAKEAVGLVEQISWVTPPEIDYAKLDAFLSRDDVKAMGGGK